MAACAQVPLSESVDGPEEEHDLGLGGGLQRVAPERARQARAAGGWACCALPSAWFGPLCCLPRSMFAAPS